MRVREEIHWQSNRNAILMNPRTPENDKKALLEALEGYQEIQGHFLLPTSGSSGALKWVALSKKAVLSSALSVNNHLESNHGDIWLNPLPTFHVGGLGILARSYLSGAKAVAYSNPQHQWDVNHFHQNLIDAEATLTAIVPTQLFDLVANQLRSPKKLRAVVVGGGRLSEELYRKGIEMGWPLLPSYGLTECASQVATAELNSLMQEDYPLLKPLDHVSLETNEEGFLVIRSRSLLSGYIYADHFQSHYIDPKIEGQFTTEDQVVLINNNIRSISRGELCIKIGGESCDILRLEQIVESLTLSLNIHCGVALIALPDERLSNAIHLAIDSHEFCINELLEEFSKRVRPFERIKKVHYVSRIPRSPLQKLLRSDLRKILLESA